MVDWRQRWPGRSERDGPGPLSGLRLEYIHEHLAVCPCTPPGIAPFAPRVEQWAHWCFIRTSHATSRCDKKACGLSQRHRPGARGAQVWA